MAYIRQLLMGSLMMIVPLGVYAETSVSDDSIVSNVKSSYVFKNYLKDDKIDVSSKAGTVTLSGTAASSSHKQLAENTAESQAGVKRVEDNISVKGENAQGNSDNWIETKVKSTLMFHRGVSGLKTEVTSKDGAVTLRGTADSQASKGLAAEYAKDIEGVKSVNNELVVQTAQAADAATLGEKIDDASITAQVKTALLYHRSTSAVKTKVDTNGGIVTVTGTAKNAAEKDLVTKLVKDIKGVKEVNNKMQISPAVNG